MKVSLARTTLNEPDKYNTEWRDNSSRVRTHSGTLRRCCSPIEDNNCAQWEASIRVTVLKWSGEGRYPEAFALELSSRLFPRPDWLPLGLRGWDRNEKPYVPSHSTFTFPCGTQKNPNHYSVLLNVIYSIGLIPPSSIVALSTSDITFLARSDERWPEEPAWRAIKGMFFVWGK